MRHDETRDNTTAIENQSVEADAHADAHADTREGVEGSDPTGRETWRERKLRLAEATFGKVGSSRMSRAMENRDTTTGARANPTTVCPCGEVVEIEWDHEYDDGWNVCGVECPKCGRRSCGGNARDATVNSWATPRQVYQANEAFEQMEFEAELYQETGIRFGG